MIHNGFINKYELYSILQLLPEIDVCSKPKRVFFIFFSLHVGQCSLLLLHLLLSTPSIFFLQIYICYADRKR